MNVQPNAEAIEAAAVKLYSYDQGESTDGDQWPAWTDLPSQAQHLYRAGAREVDALLLTEAATWEASDHPDANEIWHHYMAAVAFLSNHYGQPSAAMSRPTTTEETTQ